MDLISLTQSANDKVKEQIEYVFSVFSREFSNVIYDNREKIVGIGEPNKHLFCYFKKQDDKVFVKFKSENEAIELPMIKESLEDLIKRTIDLFRSEDFTLKEKRERQGVGIARVKIEDRFYPELYFCNKLEKLKEEMDDNRDFFGQMAITLKELLTDFLIQLSYGSNSERNKDICLCLLEQRKNHLSIKNLQERYGVSRQTIGLSFIKHFSKIIRTKKMCVEKAEWFFKLRNEYLEKFSNKAIDSFMLYLKWTGNKYLLRAFIIVMLRKGRAFKDVEMSIYEAYSKIKPKKKMKCYNVYKIFLDADGEILTDLSLLEKLSKLRLQFANNCGVDEKWIYKNEQLVLLATEKTYNICDTIFNIIRDIECCRMMIYRQTIKKAKEKIKELQEKYAKWIEDKIEKQRKKVLQGKPN